jgi:hypothetical protein
VAESGLQGANFTVRVVQDGWKPSDDVSWTARVSMSTGGIVPVSLDSDSAPKLNVISFNYTSPQAIALDTSSLIYWMSGDRCDQAGTGLGSPSTVLLAASDVNQPRGRSQFSAWTGADGNLFLYGESEAVRRRDVLACGARWAILCSF